MTYSWLFNDEHTYFTFCSSLTFKFWKELLWTICFCKYTYTYIYIYIYLYIYVWIDALLSWWIGEFMNWRNKKNMNWSIIKMVNWLVDELRIHIWVNRSSDGSSALFWPFPLHAFWFFSQLWPQIGHIQNRFKCNFIPYSS